jgi:FG-GAP-like repeat
MHGRSRLLLVALCVSVSLGAFAVQALGSFGPATHFATGNYPSGIAVAKLNRDSHPDLAVASGDNVAVLLGNGAGGFGRAKHFAAGRSPSAVAIGDLNGDGKLDLAVANHN